MQTVGEVLKLIDTAKAVYVRPFFGIAEKWLKVSKSEARTIFDGYGKDMSVFSIFDFDHHLQLDVNRELYLG